MKKPAARLYGALCFLLSVAAFLYLIGFTGNLLVPKSIDTSKPSPPAAALIIDSALLSLFALQHSLMARQWFKRRWTQLIPPPLERSTYTFLASLSLGLLYWQWRPITQTVWSIPSPPLHTALYALFCAGWIITFVASALVSATELFGLSQVRSYVEDKPHTPTGFKTPGLYKAVRHPIYLGLLLAFWSVPVMTLGHLLFSSVMTAYILLAIPLEERDLLAVFGEAYRRYRLRTPMLLPFLKGPR